MHGNTATLVGSRFAPELDLDFGFDAIHPYSGLLLREWVKKELWASFDASTRRWISVRVPSNVGQMLYGAGFDFIGPDGEPVDDAGLTTPILCTSEVHGMLAVYPRMGSIDDLRRVAGDGAVWQKDSRRFLVPDDVLRDLRSINRIDLIDQYVPIDRHSASDALLYDGTIDGLRAIPVSDLDCVDPVTAVSMGVMKIATIFDLLHTIPRRYLDRSNPTPVAGVGLHQDATFIATIREIKTPPPAKRGQGVTMVSVVDDADGSTRVSCRWFNAAYIARKLAVGQHVLISGKMDEWVSDSGYRMRQINNPLIDVLSGDDAIDADAAVIGVYPSSKGITTWAVRRAIKEALRRLPALTDPIPSYLVSNHQWMSRDQAFRSVHSPQTVAEAETARQRLAYDELMRWQMVIAARRYDDTHASGIAHVFDGKLSAGVLAQLPFTTTTAQQRAITEISKDLRGQHPMQRLLQGDVGAGKSLVMQVASLDVISSGWSVAILAPTAVLAQQHYDDLIEMTADKDVTVELLTTKVTGKKKKTVLASLAGDKPVIAVGTSALLSANVVINRLGLVVIDEQHRFGVEQRAELSARAIATGNRPDVLVMTATPAPRTAVMTIFGDLDVSILDQMPSGRSPIATSIVEDITTPSSPVWVAAAAAVRQGRQVFVVTPVVSSNETKMAAGADALAGKISGSLLPGMRIGVVHGKQTPKLRAEMMKQFADGDMDIMVATTVIEVGVNVPNATVMIITGAESFGIAQLHQIRGRVGRGQFPGMCFLVPGKVAEGEDRERLEALVSSTDGFFLAQRDLEIRGHGSLDGVKQSGRKADLRIASLATDLDLVATARKDAVGLNDADPGLGRHPTLRAEIRNALGTEGISSLGTQ